MKRIAQVIPYYYPAMAFGGPAKVVYEFVKELKTFEITVLTSDACNSHKRISKTKRLKSKKNFSILYFRNIINSIAYKGRIFSHFGLITYGILNANNHDLFHFHDLFIIPQILLSYILRIKNIPYIVSPHGVLDPVRLKKKSFIKNILMLFVKGMLNKAQTLIATSEKEKNDLLNFGFNNVEIVYNGVAKSNIKASKRFNKYKKNKAITLLYVGKLHTQKGLFDFIEGLIKSGRKDIRLLIAGQDDGDEKRIRSLVKGHNLESQVLLLGFVNEPEKQNLYSIADMFIHPSYSEGFSISILEALNEGLPVLITTACNFPDVKMYNAGHILSQPNSKEISSFLKKLSNNKIGKYNNKTKNLINDRYSIKRMSSKMSKIYEEYI